MKRANLSFLYESGRERGEVTLVVSKLARAILSELLNKNSEEYRKEAFCL